MQMAERLGGMTADELEARMTWTEMLEWAGYDEAQQEAELKRKNAEMNKRALRRGR